MKTYRTKEEIEQVKNLLSKINTLIDESPFTGFAIDYDEYGFGLSIQFKDKTQSTYNPRHKTDWMVISENQGASDELDLEEAIEEAILNMEGIEYIK